MKGVVKTLIEDKGFGFIKVTDGTEYFFHKSDFRGFWDDLVTDSHAGQVEVEFEGIKTPKGPRASNVTRISEITEQR